MFTNKFATRLNSFKSKWPSDEKPTIIELIKRASKVEGLSHVDLNYPDHSEPSIREISAITNDCGLAINGLAMRYYTNPAFKLGAFTNPNKQVRQEAIDLTKVAIDALREIDSNLLTIWLGQTVLIMVFKLIIKKYGMMK